jgi:uncharacterized protein
VKFVLGDIREGGSLRCDLAKLLESRMLIQASSGSGKSRTLRRIAEQIHGHVQTIIVDPEGEFASLRERFDYVLAGKGGETPAEPRGAALLAERLLELGVSAIVDLYEMKPDARQEFVSRFFAKLVDIPKPLYHPVVTILDEAQMFAAEGAKTPAALAVVDYATRGRKRGHALVLAVSRLSKLAKDAAEPLKNKLIGGTSLDLDMKRAGDELGFDKAATRALRELEPGDFWAFGPAITRAPTLVRIGDVETSHPKAGAALKARTPPPSEKVKALLPKLADLPKEAEARAQTVAELERTNARLRTELARAVRHAPVVAAPAKVVQKVEKVVRVDRPVLKAKDVGVLDRIVTRLEGFCGGQTDLVQGMKQIASGLRAALNQAKAIGIEHEHLVTYRAIGTPLKIPTSLPIMSEETRAAVRAADTAIVRAASAKLDREIMDGALPEPERIILRAVAQHVDGVSRSQLTVLTGYKRSTRNAYVSRMKTKGLLAVQGDRITATEAGVAALGGEYEPLPTGSALWDHWRARLPEGERRILEVLVERHPEAMTTIALTEATGFKRSTRNAYLSRLRARKLVEDDGASAVRASALLFD